MKIVTSYIIIFLLLISISFYAYKKGKLADIWQNNYHANDRGKNEQIIFNLKQYKYYEKQKSDSIAKLLKINAKQIKQVILTDYKVRIDTIIKTKLVYDSTLKISYFESIYPEGCYLIKGTTLGKVADVNITSLEYNDEITTFLYDSRGYTFFDLIPRFWKKRLITAKTYSECKKDTIAITKNILIQ